MEIERKTPAEVEVQIEAMEEKRFQDRKSSKLTQLFITAIYLLAEEEWLEDQLRKVHKTWDKIYNLMD